MTRKEERPMYPSAQRHFDDTDREDVRRIWERQEAFLRLQSLVVGETEVGALMAEAGGAAA
jgi:hypothetical protein